MSTKYEVRFRGSRQTVFTVDLPEAFAELATASDGTITAVRNCVGRVIAERIDGVTRRTT